MWTIVNVRDRMCKCLVRLVNVHSDLHAAMRAHLHHSTAAAKMMVPGTVHKNPNLLGKAFSNNTVNLYCYCETIVCI